MARLTNPYVSLVALGLIATGGLLASPTTARAGNVYTSPQPIHLEQEYTYKGLSTKFASDLWLVVDDNGGGSYTVKLTGWGFIRQRNANVKLWENKHWTPLSITGAARNGVLSAVQEAGVEGGKVRTTLSLSLNDRKATQTVDLLIAGQSYRLLSTAVNVPLPRPVGGDTYTVAVHNNAGVPLTVHVRYLSLAGVWTTARYSFAQGENATLNLRTRNRTIYFRAEGGGKVWDGGSEAKLLDGRRFRPVTMGATIGRFTYTYTP